MDWGIVSTMQLKSTFSLQDKNLRDFVLKDKFLTQVYQDSQRINGLRNLMVPSNQHCLVYDYLRLIPVHIFTSSFSLSSLLFS